MNKNLLYALWAGFFSICAGLGFIPEPGGAVRILLTLLALGFFIPPALLVYRSVKEHDRRELMLVRNLSALSLLLTLVLLIVNFVSALSSEILGKMVYCLLVVVSSPMICSGHWALSMFLWACLLMVCLKFLRNRK